MLVTLTLEVLAPGLECGTTSQKNAIVQAKSLQ